MPASDALPVDSEFTFDSLASRFTSPHQTFLSKHAASKYAYVATGALVFDTSEPSTPRLLLVQRSAHDTWPNKWEVPGGGVDDTDTSILHAVARELLEEAGLKAAHIEPLSQEPILFTSSRGYKIGKFHFVVRPKEGTTGRFEVRLDENEHQRFVWASEEQAIAKKVGDVVLEFTPGQHEQVVMEGFRHIKRTLGNAQDADNAGVAAVVGS